MPFVKRLGRKVVSVRLEGDPDRASLPRMLISGWQEQSKQALHSRDDRPRMRATSAPKQLPAARKLPRCAGTSRRVHVTVFTMRSVLGAPKEFLQLIKEILQLLVRITGILNRHRRFTATVVAVGFLYAVGWSLTYLLPEHEIYRFYRLVVEKENTDQAWNLLDRNYRKTWAADAHQFASGYKTTVGYAEMRIAPRGSALNPFGCLFFNSLSFDVSFVVEDRISRQDLEDPLQQRSNARWLSIAHSTDYGRLVDGTLVFETLSMKRRYKQVITMRRTSWRSWLIGDIQNHECGLIYE